MIHFDLGIRSFTLAVGHSLHATMRVVVRVPEAQETEQRACCNVFRTPARTVGWTAEICFYIDTPSLSGNRYIPLVADRASEFPLGVPLESKQALGLGRVLTKLCLAFGLSRVIRCDGSKEFGTE